MTGPASGAGRPLARRLGTGDAALLGLGAMLGAGVFAAFAPAARAAGAGLLAGLAGGLLLFAAGVGYRAVWLRSVRSHGKAHGPG